MQRDLLKYADVLKTKKINEIYCIDKVIIITNKFIVINENLSEFSQMIVLVHELGHAILYDSREMQTLKDYDLFPKYRNKIEVEANIFTSELMYDENREDYEYNLDIDMKVLEELRELRNI